MASQELPTEHFTVNAHLLIDAVVQQTMVFIAELATAGGVRAPLAHVAGQVFRDLTNELQHRGVKKNVIADMFGMALRTYHRRVRELAESKTDVGRSVWEAVLGYVRQHGPVNGYDVHRRFAGDDAEVVAGVLSDLAQSGLVYRAGRGDSARYRIAEDVEVTDSDASTLATHEHLVWLTVYRNAGATEEFLAATNRLDLNACRVALESLIEKGRVVGSAGRWECYGPPVDTRCPAIGPASCTRPRRRSGAVGTARALRFEPPLAHVGRRPRFA